MRCLLPLTVYCISLVSLQQLQAAPVEERPDSSTRRDLLSGLAGRREDRAPAPGRRPNAAVPSSAPGRSPKWLSGFLRRPPTSGARAASGASLPRLPEASRLATRPPRVRRHAHPGSRGGHQHGQLMRVGCVLGTCQVQNLSHRLYQLIGQHGRDDSSPINPRSPHSYG